VLRRVALGFRTAVGVALLGVFEAVALPKLMFLALEVHGGDLFLGVDRSDFSPPAHSFLACAHVEGFLAAYVALVAGLGLGLVAGLGKLPFGLLLLLFLLFVLEERSAD
jgi:hypothetical protein